MTTVLVTGGAGFIGSNYIRHVLAESSDTRIINVDLLTYAGNLENLREVEGDERLRLVRADIADAAALSAALEGESFEQIVHFAAESHVDRSIEDPAAFLRTNVIGTQVVVDLGRDRGVERMVHVSTDEVYGSLGADDPAFTEQHSLRPNSPYAASKAASDLLVRAAWKTHGFPGIVTRCSNNYGPYQFPEKLIPLMITNALADQPLPVYGDGLNVRDWIHVEDHCRALERVRQAGAPGEIYNLGGESERTNLEVVGGILDCVGKPRTLIHHVSDRKGHDRRYAIDTGSTRERLGFAPAVDFEEGLAATVQWYLEQRAWWERVLSGEYRKYFERMYRWRLGES